LTSAERGTVLRIL
jgi:hypothetical protein